MNNPTLPMPTLATVLWSGRGRFHSLFRSLVLAVTGVGLLTLSAKVQAPFYPVPITMQTFVVLALGMIYGPRLGAGTVLLYLAAGGMGLPVFAGTPEKGLGLAYMLGPTGGYLLGFLLAAAVCGWLAGKGWDRAAATTFLAMLIGNLLIYVPGLLWLGSLVGWDKPVLAWGLTPFILGDLAKIILAMLVLPWAWKAARRRRAFTEPF